MITNAMFDKTNKYLLHNDQWVLKRLHKSSKQRCRGPFNNHLQDSANIPDFHPRIHLNNDAGKFE
jgi:hypothetical protein